MPLCSRCGIGYIDSEGHVCEGRRFRSPVGSASAFLRRLQLASVPSAVLAFALAISVIAPSRDQPLVNIVGAALLLCIWLQWLTVPYVIWLWAWRRPVDLGVFKRTAVILTLVVAAGCVAYAAIIVNEIRR